jgi:hypothetical protein
VSHVIGTGGVAQSALGRNVGELRNQVRTFTNRLFQGSSVRTIIHETGHGMLSRAWADGSLTREETLQIIKTFNRAMGDRRMKQGDYKGEKAALMDEAAYDAGTDADKDRMLHEAVAEFLEGNMMRTRKQSADKSGMINGGTVNKNIKATTRLFLSYLPKTLRTKWESIMNAVRGVVGMSAMRGVLMKKAIRDGTLKESDIQAFLDKLTGRDLQAEHDGIVRDEQAAILGEDVIDEDAPFSLAPSSFNGDDGTPLEQAEKFLQTLSSKELVTADGLTATISNRSAKKMASGKAVEKSESVAAHLAAIENIEELFQRGRIKESSADRDNDPNIRLIHRVVSPFDFGGKSMDALFTVKEFAQVNQGNRLYSIEAIETKNAPERESADAAPASGLTSAPQSGAQSTISTKAGESQASESSPFSLAPSITPAMDADYLTAVESGDMETAQRMVDESAKAAGFDQTHMYHGTQDERFNEFSHQKKGSGTDATDATLGFFFTEDADFASFFQYPWEVTNPYAKTPSFKAGYAPRPGIKKVFLKLGTPLVLKGSLQTQKNEKYTLAVTNATDSLKAEGYDGIVAKVKDFRGKVHTEKIVFDANQIKSADPITYDADGNVIPLSQRFDPSKDSINYSLAPSSYVDSMSVNVASRIKNPKARMAIFTRLLGKLGELKRDRDEFGVAFGKNFTRKAIEDPRKTASINREAAFREAVRRSELEDAAHAKHFGILDQPELAKLKSQPIHEYLADPDSPLKGRLMSKSVAIARGSDFFDARGFGEYDGSESSSRTLYGGQLKPDQAAKELFDNGLISQPTPDAMWQALEKEASSVAKMKEYMKAAKADMSAARVTAKAEAKAWKDERMKEEKANYSPKARLLRVLIISVCIDYTLRQNSHELYGCAKSAYATRFSATRL